MRALEKTVDLVLDRAEYGNREEMLKEISLLVALAKKEKYRIECEKFKSKYKRDFQDFERLLHSRKNQENYEQETDLDDWEFANASLQ